MNLLQSNFPLDPEPSPWSPVARTTSTDVLGRTQRAARRPDHPRDHADLRHPRAGLRLDAGRRESRLREPAAGGAMVNAHPGVSHNYLRTHEFNLWFTIATRARLEARAEGDDRGARWRRPAPRRCANCRRSTVQDPHGPGDGGRHRGARGRGEATDPIELDPQPYDKELDISVIRALQGDMQVGSQSPTRRRGQRARHVSRTISSPI